MRPLEITLAVLIAVNIVWPLLFHQTKLATARNWLAPFALIIAVIHLSMEGYRWQMMLLYVLSGVVPAMAMVRTLRSGPASTEPLWGWRLAGILVLALAAVPPVIFPVPQLPEPTGPHQVGTTIFSLTDDSRPAIYAPDPNEPREFVVQVWYPAESAPDVERAPWIQQPDRVIPAAADYLGLPEFLFGHLDLFRTHSVLDAPFTDGGSVHPVLLFSHGWSGLQVQNTYQMEELASHGYVVAAVSHTYGALITVFPDGRVVFNNPDASPVQSQDGAVEPGAERLVAQWSADLVFLLDHLEELSEADPIGRFMGRLDLSRVGVLGHSTGGGATIEFCGQDDRCRAALTMDPYMLPVSPEVQDAGLDVPLMAIFSASFTRLEENEDLFGELMEARSAVAYDLTVAGTVHYDFTDVPLLSPLSSLLGLSGEVGAQRLMAINRAYSLAFFDETLRAREAPLLDGPSGAFPEVSIEILFPTGR